MAGVNANPTPWFRVLPPEEDEEPEFNINQRGPIRMPDTNSPPIAYFYLLFSIELMKEFVRQTNRLVLGKICISTNIDNVYY